jgi:glycogen operon protein
MSWLNWQLRDEERYLLRFFKLLIALRRTQPSLRKASYDPTGSGERGIEWHGVKLNEPDWSQSSRSLAMFLRAPRGQAGDHLHVIANAWWEPLEFELPRYTWRRVVDTALPPPQDIVEPGAAVPLQHPLRYRVAGRSVVVLVAPR